MNKSSARKGLGCFKGVYWLTARGFFEFELSSYCSFLFSSSWVLRGSTGKYLMPTRSPTLLMTCNWSENVEVKAQQSWLIIYDTDGVFFFKKKKKQNVVSFTSKALTRSSLEWEADMQIRALARRRGVAGKATVTTATCSIWKKAVFNMLYTSITQ